ncbi:MAG: hypothetical protein IPM57_07320 [Oligoflexia bacterium]|nr:hypothetical protein [Oligoflexia bacterium]
MKLKLLTTTLLITIMACAGSKKNEDQAEAIKDMQVPTKNLTNDDVYDAGTYSDKEDVSDLKIKGGHMFDTIPTEKYYSIDREKLAPVGKLFYAVTDESPTRCIPAKYTMLDGKKKLVVYSKSTVPATYCIYQKTYSVEPAGFSVTMKNGGICMPAMIVSKVEDGKTVSTIDFFSKTVSMKYCFDDTFSFGAGKGVKMSIDKTSEGSKKKKKEEVEPKETIVPMTEPIN